MGSFKRPWISAHNTWATQEELEAYCADRRANAELYAWIEGQKQEGAKPVDAAFRALRAFGPRQGEIRERLERMRRRRERLDPIAVVDNVVYWTGADGTGTGMIRTFICPRTMYHLSVHGPVHHGP